jgi:hypothetical protein
MGEEMGPTTWARFFAAWWVLFSTPWHSLLISSSQVFYFSKNYMTKRFNPFDVQKVLKVKNMQK